MDRMGVIINMCVAFAMFVRLKGLDISPSSEPGFHKFYAAGTNLTISCSQNDLMHLNWYRNTSELAVCSLDQERYCKPGERYTYENGSFNMMLTNMKSDDCGQYICKTDTESKSFDLHLIDRVKALDAVEDNTSITMTTDCVYPTNTLNVQWFYIHEDGSPVVYNKPARRLEESGNCVGTCWENKALKVSSTLELPTDVSNPIQVKLMVYVEQGGEIMKRTSTKLYTIESCLPPRKDGFIIVICLAIVFMLLDIIYIICLKRQQRKHLSDAVLPILVSCVILICSIIPMMLKYETKIPDIDGNCPDDVHATNTTTVFVIAFVIITTMVHWKLIIWAIKTMTWIKRKLISMPRNRNKNKTDDRENGEMEILTTVDNSSFGREKPGCNVQVKQATSETAKGTEELMGTALENLYKWETTRCHQTLTCWPSSVNEVFIHVGGNAKLTCNFDLKYPSWQAPGGRVINYGGEGTFEDEFNDYIKWDTDKKSIIVSKASVPHAGIYVCLSPYGKVQTLTLVVALPTKKIEVGEGQVAHLEPDMTSKRPAWRRLTNIVPELYNKVHDDRIEIRDDEKSILIKNCKIADTGFYEVVGNNVTQRFELLVKNDKYTDKVFKIDEGSIIRLESSSKELYPSWKCLEAGVFNYGGEEDFRSVKSGTFIKEPSRFLWSVDEKSLVIDEILMEDTGTYICRHANGFVETVTVIVKGKPQEIDHKKDKEKDVLIPHDLGCQLPSVKFVQTDVLGETAISYQNYKTPGFKPAKTNPERIGQLTMYDKNINKDSLLECTAYRRPIHSFQFKKV